jgi:predicted dehydrogenase
VVASDVVIERAQALAAMSPGCTATPDWHEAVSHSNVEAVFVATTNQWLAPISLAAIEAGKHVLVEKPGARNSVELEPLLAASQAAGVCVQVGFNHRYHAAFQKAHEIVSSGSLGPLMFVRGRYGHGGRLGYEQEWRADPEQSGGGELLDQGVHLIDLAGWFLGSLTHVDGFAGTYFWDMPVEDNGFLLLRTALNQVAFLHASCTEWKNLFSFEIYGKNAKLQIDGLGGSYGLERLSFYRMLPEMGPPETTIWEYPGEDLSWKLELAVFEGFIERKEIPRPGLVEALNALKIVESIYRISSHDHHP